MSNATKIKRGDWESLEKLGEGGGAVVYRAANLKHLNREQLLHNTVGFIRQLDTALGTTLDQRVNAAENLLETFRNYISPSPSVFGALKIPKLDISGSSPDIERKRLEREVAAMSALSHPNVVRILDFDRKSFEWYVMELLPGGTLGSQLDRYTGQVLKTLQAIRPIVLAVIQVHGSRSPEGGYIHRDIKPNNIFIRADGDFVLGDFGIAIPRGQDTTRLTAPDKRIFSPDWAPPWLRHLPNADWTPACDVYMLGKAIYAMLSRQRNVEPSQLRRPEFDLRILFPDTLEMEPCQELLSRIIVDDEASCLSTSVELCRELDRLLSVVTPPSYLRLAMHQMRSEFDALDATRRVFADVLPESYSRFLRTEGQGSPASVAALLAEMLHLLPPTEKQLGQAQVEFQENALPWLEASGPAWRFATRIFPPMESGRNFPGLTIVPQERFADFYSAFVTLADFWSRWGQRSTHRHVPSRRWICETFSEWGPHVVLLAYLTLALRRSGWAQPPDRMPLIELARGWPLKPRQ